MQKSEQEIAHIVGQYGWDLLRREKMHIDIRCRSCGIEKHVTWNKADNYCECALAVKPLMEYEHICLRCNSTLVLCEMCNTASSGNIKCGVCSRKGFPVFEYEDRHLCLHLLDRMKMCSPTR